MTYTYTRSGELFSVGTDSGVRYESAPVNGVRQTLAAIAGPMPADVVASTVVELAFVGWTPAAE